jgi:hypothetical protein
MIGLAAIVLLSVIWFAVAAHSRKDVGPDGPIRTKGVPAVRNKSVSAKVAKGFKIARRNSTQPGANGVTADDDVDENGVKLTAEMREILAAIQDCLDREDRKSLSKLCEKIAKIQRERGYDAVPVSIRAKAVEALGLFLPATLADLVGFLADSDPEVVDSAFEQLDTLLNDTTIGDRELAGMLVAMSKVLTNEDAVDSLAMAVDMNMRNSVKVSTCKQIIDSGNEVVVTRIKETIADMLEVEVNQLPSNKEAIKNRLTEWLENNPDGEDDDDFYSGVE